MRGRGTPTIDLRLKLGLAGSTPDAATRILVPDVTVGNQLLGLALVADRVIEVATFTEAEIERAPEIGVAWRSDYLAGVLRREAGFVVLFDLPKLLTSAEDALAFTAEMCAAWLPRADYRHAFHYSIARPAVSPEFDSI